jgi:iron complex transport system ATP-binding protein
VSALSLERVTVEFGDARVVDGVSLGVAEGEWAALIGPNGAGKTSLLRAIAGLIRHGGAVALCRADTSRLCRRERARLVALVPQTPVTPTEMTVREYVLLGRTPHLRYLGREGRRDRSVAERAIGRLDLRHLAERALGSLSGGERQRAVLARALAQEARVVLLDEPTSALDLARQQYVLELVDELRREEGLTVLAAMHDLTALSAYAGQVHLLSGGRLVASGPPPEVMREDLLALHYGASLRVVEHAGALIVVPARPAARAPIESGA